MNTVRKLIPLFIELSFYNNGIDFESNASLSVSVKFPRAKSWLYFIDIQPRQVLSLNYFL